jgi:AcrR family transcriptional regulator
MERAIPVFWKHGFSGTSLQDLEKATAVNKSGLYSEFKDKEDLFLSSLRHYVAKVRVASLLERTPLGWENIEAYLKLGQTCSGQKGCFVVNTLRELTDLPPAARQILADHLKRVREGIAANAEAGGSHMPPTMLADLVMTFHSGMSVQQNYGVPISAANERIAQFLAAIRV